MSTFYLVGDATRPQRKGPRIIAHVCNDIGGWGRGFVLALNERWSVPKEWFLADSRSGRAKLGFVRIVRVEPELFVANMVAQHDIVVQNGVPPVRYDALRKCLAQLAREAMVLKASVHMPRIACGLAGGTWDKVGPIVDEELKNVFTYVYDFEDTSSPSYVKP